MTERFPFEFVHMKAAVFHKYGIPEEVRIEDIPVPEIGDKEVLVKVKAVSINSWDYDIIKGTMWVNRLLFGLSKPRVKVLGADIAGIVEAAGPKVTHLKVGDTVFGDVSNSGWGGFAEYVSAKETSLLIKPSSMSFDEAAAIPQAGVMAIQSLIDKGVVKDGQHVLMNGAGGGVGTMLIQMARHMGAELTAVDSGQKLDMLQSLGADHVVDYQKNDFTRLGRSFDLIVDVVANRKFSDYYQVLNPGGRMLMVGGKVPTMINAILFWPFKSMFGSRKLGVLGHVPNKHLDKLIAFYEQGVMKPVIDEVIPLENIVYGIRKLMDGKVIGKLVVRVD
mgnify:CR=1 FL=1